MSKSALWLLGGASLAAGVAWAAPSPFIGEWKLNASISRMPDEMKVASKGANTYAFDLGGGAAETIHVDGTDQAANEGTTLSVTAAAPDTWIVERKKDGKTLIKATWKLSLDGTTLSDVFREFEPDGSTLSMDYIYRRSGGGSGFAGHWESVKETMNTPFLLEVKPYQEDGLSFITPLRHETKSAKLDGKDYPGPGSGSSLSIRRVDEHTLEMTDKRDGQVVDTVEMRLSSDGSKLTVTAHAAGQGKPEVLVFDRQS